MPTVAALLLLALGTSAGETSEPRFALRALTGGRAPATSDDGRFAVAATAHIAAADAARFRSKAALADCDPTPPDLMFADGFED